MRFHRKEKKNQGRGEKKKSGEGKEKKKLEHQILVVDKNHLVFNKYLVK